jgi:hypothetical protein
VQRAVTAGSQLPVPLIQPEIGASYPKMNVHRYAPNNLVPLEDACVAAEGAQRGLPAIARQVLAFAADKGRLDANGRLHAYYQRRTGVPVGAAVLSSTGYACLGRLAASLGNRVAATALEPALAADMIALVDAPRAQAAPLYAAGPLLRAALALQAFPAGSP